ncbi:MAG: 7-cyano-7-deazaguanine synthase QueC [Candidatus Oxydemutatoraceae bacterium WSBS_2016_MAG_OTU14]
MLSSKKKAVVLLSGGMDSATVLALTKDAGYDIYALSLDYGQRHSAELNAAKELAKKFAVVQHQVMRLDLAPICHSALTDSNRALPHGSTAENTIPNSYVPARNIIFLSLAVAWCESLDADEVKFGANQVDYSGYPDCRGEFVEAFQHMIDCGTRRGVSARGVVIHAPLLNMSKMEIIRRGVELGIDYAQTVSCYDADANGCACSKCSACVLRRAGFVSAGLPDSTRYQMD